MILISALESLIIILVIIGVCGYIYISKQKTKELLLRDWERVEVGETDTYYTLELDFSDDTIKYNFHSFYAWLDTTIAEFDYKIISANKLEIDNDIYEIEFNDDNTMMTITPSLTDSELSENWFYHED